MDIDPGHGLRFDRRLRRLLVVWAFLSGMLSRRLHKKHLIMKGVLSRSGIQRSVRRKILSAFGEASLEQQPLFGLDDQYLGNQTGSASAGFTLRQ